MSTVVDSPSYDLDPCRVVSIGDDALAVLNRYRQQGYCASEAGGMLLGRIIQISGDLIVDVATEPNASDQRSRYRFTRRRGPAQKRVSHEWNESEGTRIYLGEWHTHPEPHPTPSWLDRREWRRLTVATQYEQECLLFMIVGTESTRMWSLCRGESKPVELLLRRNAPGVESREHVE